MIIRFSKNRCVLSASWAVVFSYEWGKREESESEIIALAVHVVNKNELFLSGIPVLKEKEGCTLQIRVMERKCSKLNRYFFPVGLDSSLNIISNGGSISIFKD